MASGPCGSWSGSTCVQDNTFNWGLLHSACSGWTFVTSWHLVAKKNWLHRTLGGKVSLLVAAETTYLFPFTLPHVAGSWLNLHLDISCTLLQAVPSDVSWLTTNIALSGFSTFWALLWVWLLAPLHATPWLHVVICELAGLCHGLRLPLGHAHSHHPRHGVEELLHSDCLPHSISISHTPPSPFLCKVHRPRHHLRIGFPASPWSQSEDGCSRSL